MSFLDTLAAFFRRPVVEQRESVPDGVCPRLRNHNARQHCPSCGTYYG